MEEDENRPPDPESIFNISDGYDSDASQVSTTIPSRKRRPSLCLDVPPKIKSLSQNKKQAPNSHGINNNTITPETKAIELTYSLSSSAPFIVNVQRTEQGKIIHPLDFGKFIFSSKYNNFGIINGSIKPEGRYKLSIEFKSASFANDFVKNIGSLSNNKFKSFIPTFNLTRMGRVKGIPTDLSETEIVDALNDSQVTPKVLKARRLNFKDTSTGTTIWKPSQSVVLTFEGQTLPSRVFIYYNALPVEVYRFPTIQCFNCCRFGHSKPICRSPPRCFHCGEDHPFEQCQNTTKNPICINCKGNHTAVSVACPELSRQRNIKQSMASDNISYFQASKLFPPSKKSFAEITSNPSIFNFSSPESPLSTSHRETIFKPIKSKPKFIPYFDKKQHNDLLLNPNGNNKSQAPNGNALKNCPSSDIFPKVMIDNSSFIQTLITLLITILSNNNNVPSNAADYIKSLLSCLPNASQTEPNSAME